MSKYFFSLIAVILFNSVSLADDLYRVEVHNQNDADILNSMQATPVLETTNGYLALLPSQFSELLSETNINYELIQTDLSLEHLFLQSRHDMQFADTKNVLYEHNGIMLILESIQSLATSINPQHHIFSIPDRKNAILYTPLSASNFSEMTAIDGLDTLIDKVLQDSLESYLYHLESFDGRLTATQSFYDSRDWIGDKFREFGYDSVLFDTFTGSQLYGRVPVESYNVIAYKIGTKFPDQQIIIGAHYDAVPDSPGSDDNGTGTAAVLELARLFKDIETDKTIIFITFDSEESGLHGSYHYADAARARGDNIVAMLNADMIGNVGNNYEAKLFTGADQGYARLWNEIAPSLVNITGELGSSGSSDHYPFQVNGYDVLFLHEFIFSSVYHSYRDSTSYINFEYMTRMVKGLLATAYSADQLPSAVTGLIVEQVGDGSSLFLHWDSLSALYITNYQIYYHKTSEPEMLDSIYVSNSHTYRLVENLEESVEYSFYLKAFDFDGKTSILYDIVLATPLSQPFSPNGIQALPILQAIKIDWERNNKELDFSHYQLYRDSLVIANIPDTFYVDDAVTLGTDLHEYFVVAVDNDNNISSIELAERVVSRKAVLEQNKILAVNRSNYGTYYLVDEVETGNFMRDALSEYDFDYFSDTAYTALYSEKEPLHLFDMLDYEIIIIGAESGLIDDIATSLDRTNLSEFLSYYLSIGGKLVIFGKSGHLRNSTMTINYNGYLPDYLRIYPDYFNISSRVFHATTATPVLQDLVYSAELIGAKSELSGYPDLTWDSSLTYQHAYPSISATGIPLSNYVTFNSADVEVLYSFQSNLPGSEFENKPVAWKSTTGPNKYVYFDIPLSFFGRTQATIALQKAVQDLQDIPTDIDDNSDLTLLPTQIELSQNYPNPFNPSTTIQFTLPERTHISILVYNILGQQIQMLTDEVYPAGLHEVKWDGTNSTGDKVSSGIYLYKIASDEYSTSKKMVLLK